MSLVEKRWNSIGTTRRDALKVLGGVMLGALIVGFAEREDRSSKSLPEENAIGKNKSQTDEVVAENLLIGMGDPGIDNWTSQEFTIFCQKTGKLSNTPDQTAFCELQKSEPMTRPINPAELTPVR